MCCGLPLAYLPSELWFGKTNCFRVPATGSSVDGAGEGIRTPDLLITNQLLYRPELRQPRQKVNFSTSRATLQAPAQPANPPVPGPTPVLSATTHCTHFDRRFLSASKIAIPA